jgi:hypothetical protein
VKDARSPIGCWKYLYSEEIFEVAIQHTNKHADKQTIIPKRRSSNLTGKCEIKAMIGLLYLTGVIHSNHLKTNYLQATDGMGIELFFMVMSQERFVFAFF